MLQLRVLINSYRKTYVLVHQELPPLPGELEDGDNDGYEHPAHQDNEDTTEVGEAELRAGSCPLRLAGPAAPHLLPPLDLQLLEDAVLLQCQDACRDGRGVGRVFRQSYAVSLAVQEPSQLPEVAVPLDVVLNAGRLHEEGVHPVLLPDPVQTWSDFTLQT